MTEESKKSDKTSESNERVFVRMYVDAIKSGMMADMGIENWQTLCTLAAYMDKGGRCFPSQDLLAANMGITRSAANARVQRLLDYKWHELAIVTMEKQRDSGKFARNVYTILPNSGLEIF